MPNMAKLVSVIRSDDYPFERRQLPLQCDDTLSMVLQFEDTCLGCSKESLKQEELEKFVQRFHLMSNDEIAVALMVTNKELFSLLSQLVPCVGCRRSVERLFGELSRSNQPALEPLIVNTYSVLSMKREYLFDPKALFALFHIHGCDVSTVVEAIPKTKKNKRCTLHSLDSHTCKNKTLGVWMEIWDIMSTECRDEVVVIEYNGLMKTVDNYLRKHRFCSECKSKVLKAYNILIGEVDWKNEKGYVAALYEGLRCCEQEKHVHVSSNTDYISHLITRAEPELMQSGRERHAKTLDIAQEEILTCLGIHLYERLHKIWQKVRAEEQTWRILFCLGVHALSNNYQMALEKKEGVSQLELLCEELLQEEQAKQQRKVKKNRRKQKKNKGEKEAKSCSIVTDKEKENCFCSEKSSITTGDYGYSSGHEGCDNCSSRDSSDVACSEGICNHDGDTVLCHKEEFADVLGSCKACDQNSPTHKHKSLSMGCTSLQDMLQESESELEECDISQEEIEKFWANQPSVYRQRCELRQVLRQRFANLQRRNNNNS